MSEDDRPCRCPNSYFKPHRVSKCALRAARSKATAVASFGQSIGNTAANVVFQRNNSANANSVPSIEDDGSLDVTGESLFELDETEISETNFGDEDPDEREAIQRKVDQFLQSEESGGLEYSEVDDDNEPQPPETSKQRRRPRPVIQLKNNITKFLSTVPGIIAAPVNSVSNTVTNSVSKGVKTVTKNIKKATQQRQTEKDDKDDTNIPAQSHPIIARSKLDENINLLLLTVVVSACTAWLLTTLYRACYLIISYARLPAFEFQLLHARTFMLLTGTQTMIMMCLLMICYHRVLGALASLLLHHYLQPTMQSGVHSGVYDIHIGWLAFRSGFDHHEVVLHDVCWRNPVAFHKTPFLLHTTEISISFDLFNLIQFILHRENLLKIGKIAIEGLELYFEKSDDPKISTLYPLNIWAALGIPTEKTKSTALDKLFMRMLRVIRYRLLHVNIDLSINVPNLGLKSSMMILRRKRRGGNKKAAGVEEEDEDDEEDDNEDELEAATAGAAAAAEEEEEAEEEGLDDSELLEEEEAELEAALAAEDAIEEEATTTTAPVKSGAAPVERKIYIDIHRLTAFNLNIHPLDLLSNTHMESTKGTDLRLDEFIFHRKDATVRRPGHRGGGRRVLPVDLMLNRLVEQLALKLFAANTMSIAGMMGGSTANNISSSVKNIFKQR